jgi:hypothetical protein
MNMAHTIIRSSPGAFMCAVVRFFVVFLVAHFGEVALARADVSHERIFEATFESKKSYADPFNDVDVDVLFTKEGRSWRVPTFWRGGNKWTVRFAPPSPGEYAYHLQSTDQGNPDLNGHEGHVTITPYSGPNELLRHGSLRVSANKRYLEHADGTPFYWLGDTWWTGLSDRLSWEGFQKLTADRRTKGFTVVQICAGLVPSNEELAPVDAGFHNEGGFVWDPQFKRINPQYFDYADRRIRHLVDAGFVPAIVGGWHQVLAQMGVSKMKQHWRYVIARYGAYPVFWIVGGEINDPPASATPNKPWPVQPQLVPGGWTEVARYIRENDPYHHPLTVHEGITPTPLGDPSLVDFDLTQASHVGWSSIALEVAQINTRYGRKEFTKPVVQGEIDYEQHNGLNFQDTERVAFWLAMLNGAAGHTYGTIEVAEAFTPDKPLHRRRSSLYTWEEAMNFPGSAQVGLNAKLLQRYPWYRFTPHPEWVVPRGTTLLDGTADIPHIDTDLFYPYMAAIAKSPLPSENEVPAGEWKRRNGTFRLPYAAGIPGEVRIIYAPYFGPASSGPPTVLGLELGVLYGAYLWDPALGVKIDLGRVERPQPGSIIFQRSATGRQGARWATQSLNDQVLSVVKGVRSANLVAAVDIKTDTDTTLILRYQDPENYIAAVYSGTDKTLSLHRRAHGENGSPLGVTVAPVADGSARLRTELRDGFGIISLTDGQRTYSSPIVSFDSLFEPPIQVVAGAAGVMHPREGKVDLGSFELRASPTLLEDAHLETKLYDAKGVYRGDISSSPGWVDFGKRKLILLDAYRPEAFPYSRDWVIILEKKR